MFLGAWLSTRETETGGLLLAQVQPQLYNTFQASLEYRVRPCLKFKKEKKRNIDLYSFCFLSPETVDVKEQHTEGNAHHGSL